MRLVIQQALKTGFQSSISYATSRMERLSSRRKRLGSQEAREIFVFEPKKIKKMKRNDTFVFPTACKK